MKDRWWVILGILVIIGLLLLVYVMQNHHADIVNIKDLFVKK